MAHQVQKPESQVSLQTQHGHTDTHVVLAFSRAVNNIMLTPEQAERFIEGIRGSMKMLADHQARLTGGAANG